MTRCNRQLHVAPAGGGALPRATHRLILRTLRFSRMGRGSSPKSPAFLSFSSFARCRGRVVGGGRQGEGWEASPLGGMVEGEGEDGKWRMERSVVIKGRRG